MSQLLEAGADPHAADGDALGERGGTALHYAAHEGHAVVVAAGRRSRCQSEGVQAVREDFVRRGFLVFRCYPGEESAGVPDWLALLPTAEVSEAVAAMGTGAGAGNVGSAEVVEWLREIQGKNPLRLTGIGPSFLEGVFEHPVKSSGKLAKRIARICPNVLGFDLERGPALLAKHLRQRPELLLIWG